MLCSVPVQYGGSEQVVDVVLIVRNCARALETTLDRLPRKDLRSVIVVDNGSTDSTGQVGRDRGAVTLRATNGGYGAACLRALRHLEALPVAPHVVVFLDPTGSDDPADLPKLLVPFRSDNAEMVLATDVDGRHQRALGDRALLGLIGVIYGHHFSELSSFRALRFSALVALGLSDQSEGLNIEMLVKALRLGLRIVEVPVGRLEKPAGRDENVRRRSGAGRKLFRILRHATVR